MLADEGFIVLRRVYGREDIDQLRESTGQLLGGLPRHPELGAVRVLPWPTWVNEPLRRELKRLLGEDCLLIPEAAAHADGFGGWHKDTTSQERAGLLFHKAADFRMLQVALYLQDGGLEVQPGSHLLPDRHLNAVDETVWDRVRTKLKRLRPRRGYEIPSVAGDVVVFDMRLDHKASWKRPPAEKLALFFVASANNAHAQSYVSYIRTRYPNVPETPRPL